MAVKAKARKYDPPSSHVAAHDIEKSGSAADHRAICLKAVGDYPGSTSAEIASKVRLDRHAVARRLPELRDGGLVVNGKERKCSVTDRSSMTWRLFEPKSEEEVDPRYCFQTAGPEQPTLR